jgi:hypothetical protein
LNSLHKKLNASNKQIEQLRQEVERYKNLTLATSFGNSTTRHNSHEHDDYDSSSRANSSNNSKRLDEMDKKLSDVILDNQKLHEKINTVKEENVGLRSAERCKSDLL